MEQRAIPVPSIPQNVTNLTGACLPNPGGTPGYSAFCATCNSPHITRIFWMLRA